MAMNPCQRWTLRVVCVSTALLLVNVAAPNVALPDIADDLGASFTDLQWTLSGYALALAVFLLTAGTLADRFGRKKLFVLGLLVFDVSSVLCAAAPPR
jgi:MFS family permease